MEGIQDEILTRLSKIADLKVISRTSTQKYKSAPDNLRDVARELGVANILEGSVQKSNDQVRVNVQLINALTDAHLWADTYDRKLTDMFAVESEIAKTIAETLQARLTGSEKTAISKKPTENPEAYELYLKGRFFWNKRTADDLRKSIDYFNQAIEKDPNYAQAYAGLAQAWKLLPAFNGGAPKDCFPQAEAAAKKALALDDTSSSAHAALASLKGLNGFDYPGAISEYERALQLNPNDATAHQWFANDTLANIGQNERELTEMKRAVELDPLSLVINSNLGWAYIHLGRLDEAIAQLRKTVEMDGAFYYARLLVRVGPGVERRHSGSDRGISEDDCHQRRSHSARNVGPAFTLRRVEKMKRRKFFNNCASDESNITLRLTHWLWFISAWVITMRRSTGSRRVIRSATALTSGQSVLIRSSLRFAAIRVSKRSLRRLCRTREFRASSK